MHTHVCTRRHTYARSLSAQTLTQGPSRHGSLPAARRTAALAGITGPSCFKGQALNPQKVTPNSARRGSSSLPPPSAAGSGLLCRGVFIRGQLDPAQPSWRHSAGNSSPPKRRRWHPSLLRVTSPRLCHCLSAVPRASALGLEKQSRHIQPPTALGAHVLGPQLALPGTEHRHASHPRLSQQA